jgi:hypothetical protein
LVILWIFNVAMGNHHFLKVNHHKSCGNETFSIAMLNNQRVYVPWGLCVDTLYCPEAIFDPKWSEMLVDESSQNGFLVCHVF